MKNPTLISFIMLMLWSAYSYGQCGGDSTFTVDTLNNNCVVWSMNEKKVELTFTRANTPGIEKVSWTWDDGTYSFNLPNETITHKTYQLSETYTVKMVRECAGGLKDSFIHDVNIYDNPSISAFRVEASPSCSPATERLILNIKTPISPETEITWNFGDRTAPVRWYYNQPYSETNKRNGDTITHIYKNSSCNNTFSIQSEEICKNCFGIVVTARNHCKNSMALFAIAPIVIYGKPEAFFSINNDSLITTPLKPTETELNPDTLYQLCSTGIVKLQNLSGLGKGFNCEPPDTIDWLVVNLENGINENLPRYICEKEGCDSIFEWDFKNRGTYDITLRQSNNCGDSAYTKQLVIRERPKLRFDFGGTIDCYPAVVNFVNKSDTLDYYEWFFDLTTAVNTITDFHPAPQLYKDEGEYNMWLKGKDDFCENRYDTTLILNQLCEDLYVPNAFLPESADERFRLFRPVAANLVTYKLEIFNLRGELLWETDAIIDGHPQSGWDGKYKDQECPSGNYMWKIEATFRDGMGYLREWKGQAETKGNRKRVGTLSLIR